MIEVPQPVQNKARAHGAAAWLVDLPDLVASLAADWGLRIGRAFPDATEAFVCGATAADGTPAVLKVCVPRSLDAAALEIAALRLADGAGCARLLRDDADRAALLLERLGASLFELRLPIDVRQQILCATAQRVWRPAPECGLPTGAQKAEWLAEFITETWEALDRPLSRRAVDHALECAERRRVAHDDERAVLVHGDVHQWNALQAPDGFRLVDPDGLLAEPEYDLGILMREDPVELLAGDPYERALRLAERSGLDPVAIWEWGVIERVSTGLLATRIDLQPVGSQMLVAAERAAERP